MKTRTQIADELMTGCDHDEDWGQDERKPWTDHETIAEAIRGGTPKCDILNMSEMESWPETYEWVKNELKEE